MRERIYRSLAVRDILMSLDFKKILEETGYRGFSADDFDISKVINLKTGEFKVYDEELMVAQDRLDVITDDPEYFVIHDPNTQDGPILKTMIEMIARNAGAILVQNNGTIPPEKYNNIFATFMYEAGIKKGRVILGRDNLLHSRHIQSIRSRRVPKGLERELNPKTIDEYIEDIRKGFENYPNYKSPEERELRLKEINAGLEFFKREYQTYVPLRKIAKGKKRIQSASTFGKNKKCFGVCFLENYGKKQATLEDLTAGILAMAIAYVQYPTISIMGGHKDFPHENQKVKPIDPQDGFPLEFMKAVAREIQRQRDRILQHYDKDFTPESSMADSVRVLDNVAYQELNKELSHSR